MSFDIRELLNCGKKLYVVCTGAGAGLQEGLWEVPGVSKILLGAEFPYAEEFTDKLLKFKPDKYCSEQTAVSLAMAAYYKAYKWGQPTVGVGLTASVASVKDHRGDHRVHVAYMNDNEVKVTTVILPKGFDRRLIDGDIADRLGFYAVCEGCEVNYPKPLDFTWKDATE